MTLLSRSLRPVLLCAIAPLLLYPSRARGLPIYRLDAGLSAVAAAATGGPEFVGREAWVTDAGGNQDGLANPGEHIDARIRLVNVGEAAGPTQEYITVNDADVVVRTTVAEQFGWPAGEARAIGFSMDIAPTATAHDVSVIVRLEADGGGTWHFFFTFPIVAPAVDFVIDGAVVIDPVPGGNNDGRAGPGERIQSRLSLRNVGRADAGDVRVGITVFDPDVTVVVGEAVHSSWPAGTSQDSGFALDISASALTRDVVVFVTVTTGNAGPWRFSFVVAVVAPAPDFELRNSWIFDPRPGGNRDGRAVPGERVLPRVRLRNIGAVDARDVVVTIAVADPTVTVADGVVTHASWPVGEVRNNGALAFDVSPDAQPGEFTATVTVTADVAGPWQFEIPFTIAEPDVSFALETSWVFDPRPGGNRDHRANRAESVAPRVRLRNTGTDEAQGVTVLLASADPDITVTAGEIAHGRWPAEAGRNNTGFALDVSPDAQPHDATLSVTVTTAHGGPWQFSVGLPIFYAPVEFVQRNAWVFDPEPGGDRDGQAEAGERVRPRLRLLHVGSEEARNVRVSLATDDPEVTIAEGEVLHETWAPGAARNNGFVLDIASDAAAHDVTLRATIRADNGGPWDVAFVLRIVAPRAAFAFQGVTRGTVEVNGSGPPGPKLRHVGTEPLRNVRVTLASGDPDVTVVTTQQVHETWLPGETRESDDLRVRAAADVEPRTALLVLSVTTEDGRLWQFRFTIALARSTKFDMLLGVVRDDAPGGDGNRQNNPGETVLPWLRFRNVGLAASRNVVVTLTTDDPDVTVLGDDYTVAAWGRLSRVWIPGFSLLIADDATTHEATVHATLTADHGDPVRHTIAFHITRKPPIFALRNAWVWDPAPGANHDGQANPGERVFPRVRIRNNAQTAASNIHAVLSVADEDITVVNGIVTHDEWPGGEARNNNGFVLDISETATPHDVQAVLSVTADDAGAWQFSFTIPIAGAQVATTALLANYPNPFNPETWIPFDLSEASQVTVSVYDPHGVVVRRLDLGRLAPGAHRGRSSAAYWDGRNDFGERVSSGMYMYELRAGRHREMRRMIVRK